MIYTLQIIAQDFNKKQITHSPISISTISSDVNKISPEEILIVAQALKDQIKSILESFIPQSFIMD
jgi:hypothetical protein